MDGRAVRGKIFFSLNGDQLAPVRLLRSAVRRDTLRCLQLYVAKQEIPFLDVELQFMYPCLQFQLEWK